MYFVALSDFLHACTHEAGDEDVGIDEDLRSQCRQNAKKNYELLIMAPIPPGAYVAVNSRNERIDDHTASSQIERNGREDSGDLPRFKNLPTAKFELGLLPAPQKPGPVPVKVEPGSSNKRQACGAQPVAAVPFKKLRTCESAMQGTRDMARNAQKKIADESLRYWKDGRPQYERWDSPSPNAAPPAAREGDHIALGSDDEYATKEELHHDDAHPVATAAGC